MLLAYRSDFYSAGLPEPPDVRLLVEVADSSLLYDRRTKLVALDSGRIEIHRNASGGAYVDVRLLRADEMFAPAAFPDLLITQRDLLG